MSETPNTHWIKHGDVVYWVPDDEGQPRDGDHENGLVIQPRRRDEGQVLVVSRQDFEFHAGEWTARDGQSGLRAVGSLSADASHLWTPRA